MTDLPRHPLTGVEAIAVLPSGRIVWPITGGDGTDDDEATDKDAKGKSGGAGDGDDEDDDAADKDADKGKDTGNDAAKWKALARKHEAQAKANAAAAKRLKEIEDAGKTEEQRKSDKLAEAERRAAEAESRSLRYEIAAEKGLTIKMAKRLVGTTREEMEADADELLAELGGGAGGDKGDKGSEGGADDKSGRPREKLRPGAVPGAEAEETDPAKLAAKVPRI
jgi:hypothetical protein